MGRTVRRQVWEFIGDREVTSQDLAAHFGGPVKAWRAQLRDMLTLGYVECVQQQHPKRYVRGSRVPYEGSVEAAKKAAARQARRYVDAGVTIHGDMRPTGDADESRAVYKYAPRPEHIGEHQRWRQQPDQAPVFSTLGIGRYIDG